MLALSRALLYRLNTVHLLPGEGGSCHPRRPDQPLLLAGSWRTDLEGLPNVGLMTAICSVLAYLLEPIPLPDWVTIFVTLVAVLLLSARKKLHRLTRWLEVSEIARPPAG